MIRNVVRVLLLNDDQELLLMKINPQCWNLKRVDGTPQVEPYWITLGGKIEENEDVFQAVQREIFEETGMTDLDIGPIVWLEQYCLFFKDVLTHYKNAYVVAKTKQKTLSFENFTENEKQYVMDMRWFSFQEIQERTENIHPINPLLFINYLPDILKENYPKIPLNFSV